MVRFTEGIAHLVTHPTGKWMVAGATLVFFCAASFVTLRYSRIGDANPGVSLFWPDHPLNVATGVIGGRFGGVDTLVIYGEGDRADSVGEQRFLLGMEELERDRAHPSAPFTDPEQMVDFAYYMVGPPLPTRAHTLRVKHRTEQGYENLPVMETSEHGLPPWIEKFRGAALERYQDELLALRPGARFLWPEGLADWDLRDVELWWDGAGFGIRAVAVNTRDLLVQDLRSPDDPVPIHQPTLTWTRGAHFQLAGGVMGILSAVNQEVERGHRANISLILLVIFLHHSATYRSLPSGAIVWLQVSTATLFSLAYLAVRGIGLNINTLPVQAVGVGIGVDYAIYIVDRIRQEVGATGDVDEAIRRAVCTTGMAVTFTATTVVCGILFWVFSNLRFQAEMAQLLCVLMTVKMLGAITMVPAFYSIVRPKLVTSRLRGPGELAAPAEIGSPESIE